MKVREFLRSIVDPLKLNNQDLETALQSSALGEIEIPDLVKDKFNEGYLTPDRAASDEKVLAKARGAVYSMVEQRLSKTIKSKLKEEDQKAFDEAPQLFDKIDYLPKALENIAAAPVDDVKKIQEAARKTESELRSQIKTFEDNFKKSEDHKKTELEGLKLDYALRTRLAGIEVAPEFSKEEQKDFLANSTIDFLKKNFVLQFDEKNPSTIHLRKSSDAGLVVDVYEFEGEKRQTPFTLDDVVKKKYDPFVKKNNTNQNDKDKDQPKDQPLKIPNDRPLTLREKMMAEAG